MNPSLAADKKGSTADAFVVGIAAMLVINVLQRVVGLARNFGFSLFLAEDQLGLWALANSFFIIAPPFIVLGLPGSFGKFVEHYRQRGNLTTYLVRVSRICLVGLVASSFLLLLFPDQVSNSLYGQQQPYSIIAWTVVTLAILTVHNFLNEIVQSLRMIRLVSIMQFVNSASFCLLGVAGIYYFKTWSVLLPCYALACILAMLPGLYGLSTARKDFEETQRLSSSDMWRRILPFAVAMWLINLLTNAFELCDRYMLLHFSNLGAEAGQALVGQYYCAKILPNLLLSLAMMFSGIMLPYLSADWELKQFAKISKSMNNILVILSLLFTGLSLGALAAAPLLFNWVLGSRFTPALEILPIGMMQATWAGLAMIAANYLLCAEKSRQNAAILAVGLGLNLALSWPLISWLGLSGAAMASSTSNAALLLMICWRLHREGCPINRKTCLIVLLPISLVLGVYAAALIFLALAVICSRTSWLLNDEDRESINRVILPRLQRLGLPISSLWLQV